MEVGKSGPGGAEWQAVKEWQIVRLQNEKVYPYAIGFFLPEGEFRIFARFGSLHGIRRFLKDLELKVAQIAALEELEQKEVKDIIARLEQDLKERRINEVDNRGTPQDQS